MGETAEDLVTGTTCSQCGMFFIAPGSARHKPEIYTHGFPVVCKECWNEMTPQERADARKNGLQKAHARTL